MKQGTYYLSTQTDVTKAVEIYGGFNGTETQRDQRDWEINVTTVDGQDPACHCFYVTAEGIIDGLTITRGGSFNCFSDDIKDVSGGGMYIFSSSPTIRNCSFVANTTFLGGGIYNDSANPTIYKCSFSQNGLGGGGGIFNNFSDPIIANCSFSDHAISGEFFGGGAICNYFSSPTITSCSFTGNSESAHDAGGGAIWNYSSSSVIDNCYFSGNSSEEGGGAIANHGQPSSTISNCNFSENNTPSSNGGAIWNYDSSPNIFGCNFSGNSADNGGAIHNGFNATPFIQHCTFNANIGDSNGGAVVNDNSSPNIEHCIFSGNTAYGDEQLNGGGGIQNRNASPSITHCSFIDNASYRGGGIYNLQSSPIITNCTFIGNSVMLGGEPGDDGGGIYNYSSAPTSVGTSPTIADCNFEANRAENGGAIYNNDAFPTIDNCTFSLNSSGSFGGAIYNTGYLEENTTNITNCTFSENQADAGGGLASVRHSSLTVIANCVFYGNSAVFEEYGGGAIYDEEYAPGPVITNCTFSDNDAVGTGGGILSVGYLPGSTGLGALTITNSILWGNTAPVGPEIAYTVEPLSPIVTFSNVEGDYAGVGNIDADPLFVDQLNGDLRLQGNSPCIDMGSNDAPHILGTDRVGNERVIDGDNDDIAICDMGAYEYVITFMDADADGIENSIDTNPMHSNEFSDVGHGGMTTGYIESRGDQELTIYDDADPDYGIWIVSDASSGPTEAIVRACSDAVEYTISAGNEVRVTCTSVMTEVISGTVEMRLFAPNGKVASLSLNEGNSLIFDPTTFTITAPDTNSETVVVSIDGIEVSIDPGNETQIVDVDIRPRKYLNRLKVELDDGECEDEKKLRVGILTTPNFDAREVDVSTLELGDPDLVGTTTPLRSKIKRVDHDRDKDLLLIFSICDLINSGAMDLNSSELALTGMTLDGMPIQGADSVVIIVDDDDDDDDNGKGRKRKRRKGKDD